MDNGINLIDFYQRFGTEQACRDYLEQARWGKDISCPKCGVIGKAYRYKSGKLYKCGDCRSQFTVRVGTVFEDSKLPLQKWFLAIYLATSLKKGISSIQLSKYLGITQKSAWFMLHRIRYVFDNETYEKLDGKVEVDETYVGGKRRGSKRGRGSSGEAGRVKTNQIIVGDALTELKKLPSDSIDLIPTDPPYGIGFMGKEWDTFKPEQVKNGVKRSSRKKPVTNPESRNKGSAAMEAARYDHSPAGAKRFREWFYEISVEMLRVLKPGGFAFVCIGSRQDSVSACVQAMTEAGFKTDFTSLFWTYASGFPKASNIGKMVDKRLGAERGRMKPPQVIDGWRKSEGRTDKQETIPDHVPVSSEAKALDGSYGGFQPKPAVEVILVAMKPLSEKTFVDQAMKNGKGVTWLDDGRIPTSGDKEPTKAYKSGKAPFDGGTREGDYSVSHDGKGRFPANLIVSDDALNDGQTRKTGGGDKANKLPTNSTQVVPTKDGGDWAVDSGSYSRYFDLDAWFNERLKELPEGVRKTFPFLIVPKPAKSEKNNGVNLPKKKAGVKNDSGRGYSETDPHKEIMAANHHPTVKPVKLMSYLITIGSQPGDLVLDPFVGSGTTCVAAEAIGRKYIGIEKEQEYAEIANERLKQQGLGI